MKKIIIAGGTGFIGKCLAQHFKAKGYQTIILTRKYSDVQKNKDYLLWDGKTIGPWASELENADVVINLSGKSVDCRYTDANKKLILDSRVDSTTIIGQAINECNKPPKLWLNSSTATIYRDSTDISMSETNGEMGNDFSMGVAQAWEKALNESSTPNTRKIALRISLVLGKEGVYPVLSRLTKFGLGGYHGNGKQIFAWIHIEDIIRIVDFTIVHEQLEGPINCAAPETITNRQFTKTLRKTLNIPFGIPTPAPLLEIGCFLLRTESELILKSRYVEPQRLLDNGFVFRFKTAEQALNDLKK
ncbi:MAG: TIGR01777 family oxidoreductase [Flavobacteriales bacterium]|nr:TIGR01777 family oxidoreductase [Flavobacteriales bacterium]